MAVTDGSTVSIVMPCHNSGQWVGRMLISVLHQTHTSIEMICVDDGSTDNTEVVIASYKDLFFQKGMKLIYSKQSKSGQSAAINTGLQLANGEYLTWVDSDDFLTADSIEKKLIALKKNPDIGIVTSNFNIVKEEALDKVIGTGFESYGALNFQPNQFYLALTGMSRVEANCHLVRSADFDSVFNNRKIVDCKEGQNIQLLLPIYYRFKRMYIDKPLAYYVIRKDSHSHSERSDKEQAIRRNNLKRMINEVLSEMGMPESEIARCKRMPYYIYDSI